MLRKRDVRRCVTKWYERFGVQDWTLTVHMDEHSWDPSSDTTQAYVLINPDYRTVNLYYNPEWRRWEQSHLDRITCHEMLHLVLSDMSWVGSYGVPSMYGGKKKHGVDTLVDHVEEVTIDRLSYALTRAFGEDV